MSAVVIGVLETGELKGGKDFYSRVRNVKEMQAIVTVANQQQLTSKIIQI